MAKVYTARDMRQKAFALELIGHDEAAAMLRQAADALEREKKRDKKKYEYAAKYVNGFVSEAHFNTANGTAYAHDSTNFASVVRRQVGEWEEVNI